MRKNIVAGNWKMNLKREEALALASEILSQISKDGNTEVIFAPSFLDLFKQSITILASKGLEPILFKNNETLLPILTAFLFDSIILFP